MDINQNPELSDYQRENTLNEEKLDTLLKTFLPDLWVLVQFIYKNDINPFILVKVIRQLKMIDDGTGYGEVEIMIEDHVVKFVKGTEKDKLNEPIRTNKSTTLQNNN